MQDNESPPCEVCGKSSLVGIIDRAENEPIADEKGQLWYSGRAIGPMHYYCVEHVRPRMLWERSGLKMEMVTVDEVEDA